MYKYRVPAYPPPSFQEHQYEINNNFKKRKAKFNYRVNQYEPDLKSTLLEESTHNDDTRFESFNLGNVFHINPDEVLFEILGLKIYFDDLLIICILLFLYQEGIKDQYLFISLILLLLS